MRFVVDKDAKYENRTAIAIVVNQMINNEERARFTKAAIERIKSWLNRNLQPQEPSAWEIDPVHKNGYQCGYPEASWFASVLVAKEGQPTQPVNLLELASIMFVDGQAVQQGTPFELYGDRFAWAPSKRVVNDDTELTIRAKKQ